MRHLITATLFLLVLSLAPHGLYAQGTPEDDPISMGHPLTYWMKAIRDRDIENSEAAFDAIFKLGPKAWRAVPELTEIISEPFAPIRMGTDSKSVIHQKLLDIHLRAGAIDSLGAIGKAAAEAVEPAIRWGLTIRVTTTDALSARDPFFVELVGVDVLERMRVAGAVARFGIGASAAVQDLVESPDNEKRKFAAAILNDTTITIATELMQSKHCEDRMTGLSLLSGMWPVVSKDHLAILKETLSCTGLGAEPDSRNEKPFGSLKTGGTR